MTNHATVTVHGKTFEPFITSTQIAERVAVLSAQINAEYADKKPLMLGILNGAFIFAADLLRGMTIDCELTFIKLSSYRGTGTTGKVQTVLGLDTDLTGRHIIIVEDIVDTGLTLHNFLTSLSANDKPASVAIASAFFKSEALQHPLSINYLGFDIPDKFIIGYGLDYDGLGRNLPDVYQLA
jgi:hypoxanthine phosphoribosyltransferase